MREYKGMPVWLRVAVVAAAVIIVTGCNDSSGSNAATSNGTTGGSATSASTGSNANSLAIAGSPASIVLVGNRYSFQPSVNSPEDKRIAFSVVNKPAWMVFNEQTGTLSGVPTATDTGEYAHIVISATDGLSTASLPAFALIVADSASGTVTISWTPPTTNSNGSVIDNLAGYQINYGQSATALTQSVKVNTVGLTNYVVDNLTPGVWYFSIQAFNSAGVSSSPTPVVSATVGQD